MDVRALLSPPDGKRPEPFMSSSEGPNLGPNLTPLTSFRSDNPLPPISKARPSTQNRLPPSPPWSPDTMAPKHDASYSQQSNTQRDPELFPETDEGGSVTSAPLFPPDQASIEAAVNHHITKQKQVEARYKPTKEEYMAVASMVSTVVRQMKLDPRAWYRREREYLDRQVAARPSRVEKKPNQRGYQAIAPKTSKGEAAPKKQKQRQKPANLAPKTPRVPRAPRQTPQTQVVRSVGGAMSPPPPKTPRQPSTRDDVDFDSVPDVTPPLSSLSETPKTLNMEWKGQPRDLSHDPHRHLLHETELQLATNLRLSCAQYLTAKRRIFVSRVHCERIHKEFRKTDAQQACKIDVNKASKLWTAFEKVGWLDRSHIEGFL